MSRSKKPTTKRPRKALLLESFEDRILCSVAPVAEIEMGPEEAPVAPPEVAHSANVNNLAPEPVQATSADAPAATELTDAQRAAIEDVVRDSTNKIEFQENVGQFAEGVRFGFKTPFGAMQVFDDHLQIVANQYDATTGEFVGAHTVNVNFTGSQAWSIVPGGEASVVGNYMQADGTALTPHIYNELTLRDVYTGVDLRLYSAENGIVEFDWIVAKAQDYEKIRLEFAGQDGLIFNADGSATLDLRMQDLTLKMPEVYQVIDGQKHLLGGAMVAGENEGEMRYSLTGSIVADQPLVIDPNVAWSTYFDLNDTSAANAFDSYLFAVQVNSAGVYCAGWVKETITNGSFGNYMQVNAGFAAGSATNLNYIYRLNTSGTAITAWTSTGIVGSSTGSTSTNPATDLKLFPDGRALVAYRNSALQLYSADLATQSYTGTPVVLSTVNSLAIVDNNTFYVGGVIAAANAGLIPAASGLDDVFAGTSEGVIVRYTLNGSSVPVADWATYVGGDNVESFTAIAMTPDMSKLVFAVHSTVGAAYPGMVNAVDSTAGGTSELLTGVISEQAVKPTGFNVFSFLGGSSTEGTTGSNTAAGVVVATNTGYWVGGNTASVDLPSTAGSAQAANGGGTNDAFASFIPIDGSAGSGFRSTYLGGAGNELMGGIAYDVVRDRVFLFGTTSGSFPTLDTTPTSIFYQGASGGGLDIFIATFTGDLTVKDYATYIGGTGNDYMGDTGRLLGTGHVTYSAATDQVYLATTAHSVMPANIIGPGIPGYDRTKSNSTNDAHVIFAFNISIFDHGDAPTIYEGGAQAEEAISPFIRLGTTVDAEVNAAPSVGADGDDLFNTGAADDEDGIASLPLLIGRDTAYSVTVSLLNNTGSTKTLQGWIDFNGDGIFDANERATASVNTNAAQQNATLTWASLPGITPGQSYLRLRFSETLLTDNVATTIDERAIGTNNNALGHGEVEDYALTIADTSISGTVFRDDDHDGIIDVGETGVGVSTNVTLTGTDDLGAAVNLTVAADATTGAYAFTNLRPSNASGYRINETQPVGFSDGTDTAGTAGGTVTNDQISAIILAGGVNATGYNFGELLPATVGPISIQKVLVATNEAGTTGSNLVPGEIATYAIRITMPEGATPNLTVSDFVPEGMIEVGNSLVTTVAGSFGQLAANFAGSVPAPTVSGGTANGTDLTWTFGSIFSNVDGDSSNNTFVLLIQLCALDVASNVGGTVLPNTAELDVTGDAFGPLTSNLVNTFIREPALNITKSVTVGGGSSGDAGDAVNYTVGIAHTGGGSATAFDVTYSDVLPAELSAGLTIAGVTVTHSTLGNITALFQIVGGELRTIPGSSFDLVFGETVSITFNNTLPVAVEPLQIINSSANISYTGMNGDMTAAGGYNPTGEVTTDQERTYTDRANSPIRIAYDPLLTKTIVSTSEPGSVGLTTALIGEIVRYQIQARIVEGTTSGFTLRDALPTGMQFLQDGPITIAYSGVSSSITGLAAGSYTNTTLDSLVSTLAFSDEDTYGDGTDVFFKLGTLVNNDNDAGSEFVTITFNALVLNSATNNTGTVLSNSVSANFAGDGILVAENNSIRLINPVTGRISTLIPDLEAATGVSGFTGNSLAYDDVHRQVLFGDGFTQNLYRFDLATETVSSLGNIAAGLAGVAQGGADGFYTLNGGATFFNGRYYIIADDDATSATYTAAHPYNLMLELTLTADGTGIQSQTIYGGTPAAPNASWGWSLGFDDLGDFVVDPATGLATISSGDFITPAFGVGTVGVTHENGLYRFSLTTPGADRVSINHIYHNQLSLFEGEYYHNPTYVTSTLNRFNPATDALLQTITLTQSVTVNDMAYIDGTTFTSANVDVTLVEPIVALTEKQLIGASSGDAGDTVTWRQTITNTGLAPAYNIDILDALDANVSATGVSIFSASPALIGTDPVAQTVSRAGDTISLTRLDPGQTVVIQLTAQVVAGAFAGGSIPNTASLTSYTTLPGTGTALGANNTTGSITPGASGALTGEQVFTGSGSQSSALFTINTPTIDKLTPSDTTYTIGEQVTFDILVTLPEGVTQAASITDVLPAGLTYVSSSVQTFAGGVLPTTFAGTVPVPIASGGNTVFTFGNITTNADNNASNNRFVFHITARVDNVLGNQNGATLTNSAGLNYTDGTLGATTVNDSAGPITVVEPVLTFDKTVAGSTTDLSAGNTKQYTITIANPSASGATSTAFDTLLTDVVPSGLLITSIDSVSTTGTVTTDQGAAITGGNTQLIAQYDISVDGSVTITYTATLRTSVNPATDYANNATLSWSSLNGTTAGERTGVSPNIQDDGSLNDYRLTDSVTISTGSSLVLDKQVAAGPFVVGQTIPYTLVLTVFDGTTNNVQISDTLPAGLSYVAGSVSVVNSSGVTNGFVNEATSVSVVGQNVNINLGSVANPAGGGNTVTVTFNALVADVGTNANGATLTNSATGTGTGVPPSPDTTISTVAEPLLQMTKAVNDSAVDLGQSLHFTLTITHAVGSTATAFDLLVRDTLPAGLQGLTNVVVTGGTIDTNTSTASALVLKLAQLTVGGTITVEFDATVTVSTSLLGTNLDNNAKLFWDSLAAESTNSVLTGVADGNADRDYGAVTTAEVFDVDTDPAQDTERMTVNVNTLSGTIYQDVNENGVFDSGVDSPLVGETVTISGTLLAGGAFSTTATTDGSGVYTFSALAAGTYTLTETQPVGYVDGAETAGTPFGGAVSAVLNANTITSVVIPNGAANGADYNFGELLGSSLSGFVYNDANNDGTRQGTETLLNGVSVQLTGTDFLGQAVSTTLSTVGGAYSFASLRPGTYTLTETQPVGLFDGQETVGTQASGTIDNGVDSNTITTITLPQNTTGAGNNFGELTPSSFTATVYRDLSNDGVQAGAGETGIQNATVTLTGTDDRGDAVTTALTTDANGNVSYTNLRPGTYTITETQPAGFLDGIESNGTPTGTLTNDQVASITLTSGTAGVGYAFGELPPSELSGTVYQDLNNDGLINGADTTIDGVDVVLTGTDDLGAPVSLSTTTAGGGLYSFTNLRPGTYTITETQPVGLLDGQETVGTQASGMVDNGVDSNTIANITLGTDTTGAGNNFGELPPASFTATVYRDLNNDGVQAGAGETGIQNATVTLTGTDDRGDAVNTALTTDANGNVSYTNLRPGTYTITETQPAGFLDGIESNGTPTGTLTNDQVASITLTAGTAGVGYAFGELPPSELSGTVYQDLNNDGVINGADTTIDGVDVVLTGTDDLGGIVNLSTTTAGGGLYSFTNLRPGTYTITETQPVGLLDGQETVGTQASGTVDNGVDSNTIANITLGTDTTGAGNNFGELPPASFTATVYRDLNNDGVQAGAGETGIQNATVTLTGTDDRGDAVNTALTTDANGNVSYTNLRPGAYTITETQPVGFLDGLDSNGAPTGTLTNDQVATITLTSGTAGVGYAFGELPPSELSGTVYQDLNNDGLINGADTTIDGVDVVLTGTDDLGATVNLSTTTAGGGLYSFTNLRPGTYTITETQPVGLLDGQETVGTQASGTVDNGVDSNTIANITLGTDTTGAGNNFGELPPASFTATVYRDLNNDGVQAGAGETGIQNATVTLTGTDDRGDAVNTALTTDANGNVSYTNLRPGTYTISETQPAGFLDGIESNGTPTGTLTNDQVASITLTSGTAGVGYAFGELPPSSLSGTVYRDLNNDGAINGGEMGVDGETVTLTGTDDLGAPVNLSATTAGGGLYSFTNLRPGTYTITETQPVGLLDGIDTQGTPGNGAAVNDAFQNITLAANTDGADNNFGELPPSSLSGTVYRDNNNDGLISGGETGIGNVSVFLSGLDDLGNAVNLSTTTLVDGTYSFTNLRPSSAAGYTISETQPVGFLDGTDTSGTSGGIAGAVGTDSIGTIVLVSATSATAYNFGELNPASLSGAVYGDFNLDGVFDAFETGIAGVNVTLTGTDDLGAITPIVATTGVGGTYSFTNLRPGTYAITETQPVDFTDGAETLGAGLSAPNNAGSVGADTFTGIAFSTVAAGNTSGVDYNFGETPILDLSKSIVSTSVGGDTSANVVIGEVVRFRLVAAVPNGVYSNFQLRDILPAGYQFLDNGNARAGLVSAGGELTATGLTAPLTSIATPNVALASTAISTSATADGDTYLSGTDVFFKFGTLTNTDADSGTTQAVVIEFDALVVNELGNQSGATLDNSLRALFDKTNDGIPDDDALLPTPVTSTISEPFMALDKTAGTPNTNLQAGDTVTYTITFSNLAVNGATAAAFDTLILDALPAGILITSIDNVNFPMSVTQDAAVTITGGGTGLSGQFDIPIDATVTITYTGTLQTSVNPGASYDNTATLTFTSINGVDPNERTGIAPNIQGDGSVDDYRLVDTATVSTATTFVLDKTSPTGPFTIGDTVDYTLTLQLIEGTTPNVQIADALPAGLQFVPGSVVVTPGTGMSTGFVSEAASVNVVGQNVTLDLGTVVNPAGGGNTVTLTFSVLVLDSAANDTTTAQGETKTNSATATGTGVPPSIDTREVQVVEPRLIVTKGVDDTTPDINQVVNYTVSIEHAATSGSAAYDIRVRDLLPAGLDLDEATLTITSGIANIVTNVSAGNLLDFTLDQLALGQSITFTYQARVVNALTTVGTSQDNNVRLYWDTQAADEPTNIIFDGGADGTPDRDFGATPGYTESGTPAPDDDAQDTVTLTVNTNSIAGTVYRDDDGSGTFTLGDATLNTDVRLVGTTNSGLPVDITLTTVGGAYNFTNLPAGIYTLTETQPLGHTDGLETIGTAFGGPALISDAVGSNTIADITIPTQGSTAATDYNFGETLASSLAGTVYRDFSNDGIVGGTEPGISGVTVTLAGTDIYGVVVNETLTTAGDGTYLFNSIGGLAEGLRPGNYTITEVAGPALAPYFDGIDTVGTAGSALAGTAPEFDAIAVALMQDTTGTGYTFGELDPASISGSAYADFNNDGVRDANEPGINNVSIRLQGTDDRANPVDITLVTDATGAYSFTGLRPGTYSVTETAQPGGYADGTDSIGTGLVGGLNNPGTAGNEVLSGIVIADVAPGNNAGVNYNFGELYNPEILKSITSTSEAFTGPVLGTERVAVGEFVRYRLVVQAVDSAFTDFVIRDTLPAGIRPLEGPATIAIVSNGGLQSSFGFGGAQVFGNSSATGTNVQIPFGNISSDLANTEDNYGSGSSIYFHLGNVVNNDADADNEYFVIEFVAQVVNEVGNQAGTTLSNTFDVLLDLDASGATADLEVAASLAAPLDVVVAEANLAIGKTLVTSTTPTDAGDLVTYRITLTNNASGDNAAPAFDFRILDILDAISAGNAGMDLELIDTTLGSGITITAPGGTTLSANNSTTSQLDLVFDQLNAGESVTVDIVTRVITTAPAGSTLTNSVTADYTSLPGDGSSLTVSTDGGPIAISPAVGDERNGADIAAPTDNIGPANNAVLHNYAVGATIPIGDIRSTNTPTIDKQFGTTSEASTAGTNVAIGEIVTFNIVVTLPEGTTQGVILTDNMQAGFEFLGAALDFTGSGVVPFALPVPGITSGVGSGNQIVYTLGTLTNAADNNAANDSFTLIVTARVSDLAGNVSGVTRSNAADLQFTDPDGPTVVSVPDPNGDPSVTIVEPQLQIVKSADDTTPDIDQIITYTLVLNHAGASTSDAFDVRIRDLIPHDALAGTGLVLDAASITVNGVAAAASTRVTANATAGDLLDLTLDQVGTAETITITYQARVANTLGNVGALADNNARIYWDSVEGDEADNAIFNETPDGTPDRDYGATPGVIEPFDTDLDPAQDGERITVNTNTITGIVYRDADTSGSFTVGDEPLDGVTVRLTGTTNSGLVVDITTQTVGGDYSFAGLPAGTYVITETQPVGLTDGVETAGVTFGGTVSNVLNDDTISAITIPEQSAETGANYNFGELTPSSLAGSVYHDLNNDGVRDALEVGLVSSVRLTGTDAFGEAVDITLPVTDGVGDGRFIFDNLGAGLRPGTYTLTQDVQPTGFLDGKETAGTSAGTANSLTETISDIPLAQGAAATDYLFGEVLASTLSGTVYLDKSNDGILDVGEPLIGGVLITLSGTDDRGDAVSATFTTLADGTYAFPGLRPGDYTLTETQPAAYNDGLDTAGTIGGTVANDAISAITATSGSTGTGYNFGERGTTLAGNVWVDRDRDGIRELGTEPNSVAGVLITLLDSNDDIVDTAITDASGDYIFRHLPAGDYTLVQTQPTGYGSSTLNILPVTLPLVGLTDQNFGETVSTISGQVFRDDNIDGVFAGSDRGIPGVPIRLTGTDVNGLPVSLSTTTDVDGNYLFIDLIAGTYNVTETQPTDYTDSVDIIGTAGGNNTINDRISGINLNAGVDGIGYSFAEIFRFEPTKEIVSTNNIGTSGSNVSIGETIRFRLIMAIPDGPLTDLVLEEHLPAGLVFRNDGTAAVAFISGTGTGISSTMLVGTGLGSTDFNVTPTYLLADAQVTATLGLNDDTYRSGTDVFFRLGNLSNTETAIGDPEREFVVIEFNAQVVNQAANQNGRVMDNTFAPRFDLNGDLTSDPLPPGIVSPPTRTIVAEPILSLDKQITAGPKTPKPGDVITFTVTIGHAADSQATAWESVFTDTLPNGMTLVSISTKATGGASVSNAAKANGAAISGQFDIPVGGQITLTYQVRIGANVKGGTTLTNGADITWTSMPGDVPTERKSGDSLLGKGGLNDYELIASASVKVSAPPPAQPDVPFFWDSFNRLGYPRTSEPNSPYPYVPFDNDIYRPALLPLQPIYSGEADPGSTLVLTMFNTRGETIGTQTVVVDSGGNWLATFPSTTIRDYPNTVQISQLSAYYSLGSGPGHNLRTYYSPALSAGHFFYQSLTTIEQETDAPFLNDIEMGNPINAGAAKYNGEVLASQGAARGY